MRSIDNPFNLAPTNFTNSTCEALGSTACAEPGLRANARGIVHISRAGCRCRSAWHIPNPRAVGPPDRLWPLSHHRSVWSVIACSKSGKGSGEVRRRWFGFRGLPRSTSVRALVRKESPIRFRRLSPKARRGKKRKTTIAIANCAGAVDFKQFPFI